MKIGDRVKIAKNTQYYYQAPDVPGTVTDSVDNNIIKGWVKVKWDEIPLRERVVNGYPIAELILLDQQHKFPSEDFSEEDIDKAAKFIGAE